MSAQLAEAIEWSGWRDRTLRHSSTDPSLHVSATEKLRLAENAARAKAREDTDDISSLVSTLLSLKEEQRREVDRSAENLADSLLSNQFAEANDRNLTRLALKKVEDKRSNLAEVVAKDKPPQLRNNKRNGLPPSADFGAVENNMFGTEHYHQSLINTSSMSTHNDQAAKATTSRTNFHASAEKELLEWIHNKGTNLQRNKELLLNELRRNGDADIASVFADADSTRTNRTLSHESTAQTTPRQHRQHSQVPQTQSQSQAQAQAQYDPPRTPQQHSTGTHYQQPQPPSPSLQELASLDLDHDFSYLSNPPTAGLTHQEAVTLSSSERALDRGAPVHHPFQPTYTSGMSQSATIVAQQRREREKDRNVVRGKQPVPSAHPLSQTATSASLLSLFRNNDISGNGYIPSSEFFNTLTHLNVPLPAHKKQQLTQLLDPNRLVVVNYLNLSDESLRKFILDDGVSQESSTLDQAVNYVNAHPQTSADNQLLDIDSQQLRNIRLSNQHKDWFPKPAGFVAHPYSHTLGGTNLVQNITTHEEKKPILAHKQSPALEFIAKHLKTNPANFKKIMRKLDGDGTGEVNHGEFITGLLRLGVEFPPDSMASLLTQLDTHGRGKIDYELATEQLQEIVPSLEAQVQAQAQTQEQTPYAHPLDHSKFFSASHPASSFPNASASRATQESASLASTQRAPTTYYYDNEGERTHYFGGDGATQLVFPSSSSSSNSESHVEERNQDFPVQYMEPSPSHAVAQTEYEPDSLAVHTRTLRPSAVYPPAVSMDQYAHNPSQRSLTPPPHASASATSSTTTVRNQTISIPPSFSSTFDPLPAAAATSHLNITSHNSYVNQHHDVRQQHLNLNGTAGQVEGRGRSRTTQRPASARATHTRSASQQPYIPDGLPPTFHPHFMTSYQKELQRPLIDYYTSKELHQAQHTTAHSIHEYEVQAEAKTIQSPHQLSETLNQPFVATQKQKKISPHMIPVAAGTPSGLVTTGRSKKKMNRNKASALQTAIQAIQSRKLRNGDYTPRDEEAAAQSQVHFEAENSPALNQSYAVAYPVMTAAESSQVQVPSSSEQAPEYDAYLPRSRAFNTPFSASAGVASGMRGSAGGGSKGAFTEWIDFWETADKKREAVEAAHASKAHSNRGSRTPTHHRTQSYDAYLPRSRAFNTPFSSIAGVASGQRGSAGGGDKGAFTEWIDFWESGDKGQRVHAHADSTQNNNNVHADYFLEPVPFSNETTYRAQTAIVHDNPGLVVLDESERKHTWTNRSHGVTNVIANSRYENNPPTERKFNGETTYRAQTAIVQDNPGLVVLDESERKHTWTNRSHGVTNVIGRARYDNHSHTQEPRFSNETTYRAQTSVVQDNPGLVVLDDTGRKITWSNRSKGVSQVMRYKGDHTDFFQPRHGSVQQSPFSFTQERHSISQASTPRRHQPVDMTSTTSTFNSFDPQFSPSMTATMPRGRSAQSSSSALRSSSVGRVGSDFFQRLHTAAPAGSYSSTPLAWQQEGGAVTPRYSLRNWSDQRHRDFYGSGLRLG